MPLKKVFIYLVLFFLCLLACSCGGGGNSDSAIAASTQTPTDPVDKPPVTLSSIVITPNNAIMPRDAILQFTATGFYSDNTMKDMTASVSWSSGDTGIATINSAGQATVVASGLTTIKAEYGNISGNTSLTVPATSLSSISITPYNAIMPRATKQQFKAIGTYSDNSTADITSAVLWASGNASVATINTAGQATSVADGVATIMASYFGMITGSTTLTVTSASLTSISQITPADAVIPRGTTQQFSATGTYSNNTQGDITSAVSWSSSNTSVATISELGLATGISAGASTITATSGTMSKSTTLTVPSKTLTSLVITPITPSIPNRTTQQFNATGIYSDNTKTDLTTIVTWSSANTSVATINAAGQATAVSPGSSAISATFGSISASTTLTVPVPTLSSIVVTPSNPNITKGGVLQFTATGIYSDNSTADITATVSWSSGNASVATINSTGLATSILPGSATIKATFEKISGSTTFIVLAPTLSSIIVQPASPSIVKGSVLQFTATGVFSDNSTANITSTVSWSSSITGIATINSAGLATSTSPGVTTIRATFGAVSGSTNLTVTAPTLSSIVVTPSNPTIISGASQQFSATGTYSDNSTAVITSAVSWSSSNTSVATINSAGLATAVSAGSSTIKAMFGAVSGSTTLTVTAGCKGASPTWTAEPDFASVNACVSKASAGDTIVVTAGNANWGTNSLVIDKAIKIIGAGPDLTKISMDYTTTYHQSITVKTPLIHQNFAFRLSGFRFEKHDGRTLWIEGNSSGWRVDNIHFIGSEATNKPNHFQSHMTGDTAELAGLVDNCYFYWGLLGVGSSNTTARADSWNNSYPLGTVSAVYFENNTFDYTSATTRYTAFVDANNGGRYVFRYNNVLGNGSVQNHGTCSSAVWGAKSFEIYNNDLRSYPGNSSVSYAVIRAGSGIITRNIVGGGWATSYSGKINLRNRRSMEDDVCYTANYGACDSINEGVDNQDDSSGYLCHAQPGTGIITNGKFTSAPIYAWGNTAINICLGGTRAGLQCSTFNENATTGCPSSTCIDTTNFKPNEFVVLGGGLSDIQMQAGRDYKNNTQHPTWVPYKCPHPLAGSGSCNVNIAGRSGYTTN